MSDWITNKIDKFFGIDKLKEEMSNQNEVIKDLTGQIEKSQTLAGVVDGKYIEIITKKSNANPYNNNYVIHRGINLLAHNIASLPLQIYKGDKLKEPGTLIAGFDLQHPNPAMSLYELLYQCCVYYFYRGEFMTALNTLNPTLTLEVINPKKMKEKADKNKERILQWEYNKNIIKPDELIYARFFNPDKLRGLSIVDVVKDELLADSNAAEYITKFFDQFAQLGGVLYDDTGVASDEDMNRTVKQFNQKHQGTKNAWKTLGLPRGIKYQEIMQTMKEMQFLEGRKDVRDKILSALGIHKALFGVTDSVDRAVADNAMRQLWQHTCKPNAIRIQEAFNHTLFRRPGFKEYHCKFDFSGVAELKDSETDLLNRAKIMREFGYTTNEINERYDLGMEEIDEPAGNMRFVSSSLVPVDDFLLTVEEDEKKGIKTDDKLEKIVEILESDTKITKSKHSYIRSYNKIRRTVDKKLAGKLGNYFSKQLGRVLNILYRKSTIDEVAILTDIVNILQEEKDMLVGMMKPLYEEGSEKASKLAIETLNVDLPPAANPQIVNQMANKISRINNYTYRLIKREIQTGINAGETIDQLGERINSVYKFNASRARRIARTESNMVLNRTANETYKEHGVEKKEWSSPKARESHRKNHAQGSIPFGQTFQNGQRFPGDGIGGAGENVNCTCCLIPVVGGNNA